MEFKEEINLIFGWKLKAVNDSNIIVFSNESGYVACDCGQLARRELGKCNHFKCSNCKKELKKGKILIK
ncbi:hypothetical protein ACFJXR_13085 [Enterococcus faecalis]